MRRCSVRMNHRRHVPRRSRYRCQQAESATGASAFFLPDRPERWRARSDYSPTLDWQRARRPGRGEAAWAWDRRRVDLAGEEPPIQLPRDVVYCRFPLVDGAGNMSAVVRAAIDTTARFIMSRVPSLVACSSGMSRSPAIAAAALAKAEQVPVEDALRRVAALGPHDVSPSLWGEIKRALAM